MKKPVIWIIMAIIAVLLIRIVWVQLHEPEAPNLIANPYNTVFTE